MDTARIDALMAALGRPKRIRRPHLAFDGDYAQTNAGRIAYTRDGQGPAVLFVHGWEGSPRDFSSLIAAAIAQGASAVALDLPAHGFSDGEMLTPELAAEAILAVGQRAGPFVAIIAHSFGCPSTVLALERGLNTQALVFFAPPARQRDQLTRLARRVGLDDDEIAEVLSRLRSGGSPIDENDLVKKAASRTEPLLVIHADDDEMTPQAGGRELAAAWPRAKFVLAEGLGHNLALRDSAMVGVAIRFALG